MINSPIFCLTSDLDWASDYCIEDFISLSSRYGIKPTIFATHQSPVINAAMAAGLIDVGIHPNFSSGSTHGRDYLSVIETMFEMYPGANSFRSHSFFDNSRIISEMARRGLRYDSNICLYLQPNLVPLNLGIGLTRFPVFWEDDIHWQRTQGDWRLENFIDDILSPGLKIFNFHPFNVSVNVPDEDYYLKVKSNIQSLNGDSVEKIKYNGKGTRTFLIDLLEMLSARRERFYNLKDLYQMLPIDDFMVRKHNTNSRITPHDDADYRRYWQASDQEKQEFLKESYQKRDARDKYGTSRDFNLRELEIYCIRSFIKDKGMILDLGCGNGYTLISLGTYLDNWEMVGVDFSENLIEGAAYLSHQEKDKLKSSPKFICAEALDYMKEIKSNSVTYVITERFIQNLPSVASQKQMLQEIFRVLVPGGRLLMCEGSEKGFATLNDLRDALGLTRIAATSKDNISALRIKDDYFENYLQHEVGFKLNEKCGFSDYFIISRVLHPLLVAPQEPRFDAKINELAGKIQSKMPYRSGYGSNVLWVLEKSQV